MHIRDNSKAQGWFRKHAAAPSSVGSWKAFVARNKTVQEPLNMADGGRIGFEDAGHVKSKFYAPGAAETKKKQTTKKLFDFLANWTKDRKPTIMEVAKGSGTSTKSIKKYLKEGTDYTKTSHQEASVKGGQASGQVYKKKIGAVDEIVKSY